MEVQIIKLTDKNNKYFDTICDWQVSWWGKDFKKEKVIEFMEHCLNEEEIPQTFIALLDGNVVGMYQITMYDNVDVRPKYYPWLVNVYVDEKYRGKGICNILMKDAINRYIELGIKRIYLHSKQIGLYEKYGWKYLEEVETLEGKSRRIYYLDVA